MDFLNQTQLGWVYLSGTVDGVEVGKAIYRIEGTKLVVRAFYINPGQRGKGYGRELALELGAQMHALGLSEDSADYTFVDDTIVDDPNFEGRLNEITTSFAGKMIEEYDG